MGHKIRRLKALCNGLTLAFLAGGCAHVQNQTIANDPTLTPTQKEAVSRNLASLENKFNNLEPQEPLKLMWPLAKPKISQEFKNEDYRKYHDGIDLSAPKGTRIYAPADGKVVYAGHKFHGYGKMIVIEHGPKLTTIFGHCQKLFVRSGDLIRRGSLIGLVGRTGHATASHLHFEVRWNRIPVNPLDYMP